MSYSHQRIRVTSAGEMNNFFFYQTCNFDLVTDRLFFTVHLHCCLLPGSQTQNVNFCHVRQGLPTMKIRDKQ